MTDSLSRDRKRHRSSRKNCIYCGKSTDLSWDHLPPQNLFPPPRPSNLVTVPACRDCNGGFSRDDEYFRLALIFRSDLDSIPIIQTLRDSAKSVFERPESAGLTRTYFESTRVVDEPLPNGGKRENLQFQADYDRLSTTVTRIVKGLYYHEFDRVMPEWPVEVYYDAGFSFDEMQPVFPLHSIFRTMREVRPNVIDQHIFEYRCTEIDGWQDAQVWQLVFFTRVWFLVSVNTRRYLERDRTKTA
jgi:hypothetical protein